MLTTQYDGMEYRGVRESSRNRPSVDPATVRCCQRRRKRQSRPKSKTRQSQNKSKSSGGQSQKRSKSLGGQMQNPPQRSPNTFGEKRDVFEVSKRSESGALQDLGEDSKVDRQEELPVKSDTLQFKPHEASTRAKSSASPRSPPSRGSPTSPGSPPPKDAHSDDSAAIDRLTQPYIPSPYIFRAREALRHLERINAKCPPFYLQLDHTLAVIWTLFSEEPPISLGVVQLQWALNFLKGIYTIKGKHPKDVALCILASEGLLIERYAEMVEDVANIQKEKEKKMRRKRAHSYDILLANKSRVCKSETCLGKLSMDMDRNIVEEAELLIKEVPFSVNYFEMSEKGKTDVDQLYSKQSRSRASSDSSELGFNITQENVTEFLRKWRLELIDKIQSELKRLHSVETFIGCAETDLDNMDQAKLESIVRPDAAKRKKTDNDL